MCEYKFRNEEICKEEALPNSKYCILHIDLPEDTESAEFKKINELKEEKVKEKIEDGIFNFEGAKLFKVDFSEMTIEGTADFLDTDIRRAVSFESATIGNVWFNGARIGEDAKFGGATIGYAGFEEAKIKGDAKFGGATIGYASFEEAKIKGDAKFGGATIGYASFEEAKIKGDAVFNGAKIKGDAVFEGATIEGNAIFLGATVEGYVRFERATIEGDAEFLGATIKENARFEGATIEGKASFAEATIESDALFLGATIKGDAMFNGATIKGDAVFEGATIEGNAYFNMATIGYASARLELGGIQEYVKLFGALFGEVTIKGDVWFIGATLEGNALFRGAALGGNAHFEGATIKGNAWFDRATIEGEVGFYLSNISYLSFKDATFNNMSGQEEACRTARRIQEILGDRVLADYHFYREMEAKRKQKYLHFSLKELISKLMVKLGLENLIRKHIEFFEKILKQIHKLGLEKLLDKHNEFFGKERRIYWGFLELPVQYIFGYGVHPWRVIATWFITVFSLAFVYWYGNGIIIEENLLWWKRIILSIYFSIVTAATPGYGGYKPVPGFYQALASFEAIFGTFMWAAFIATFARKYMR